MRLALVSSTINLSFAKMGFPNMGFPENDFAHFDRPAGGLLLGAVYPCLTILWLRELSELS